MKRIAILAAKVTLVLACLGGAFAYGIAVVYYEVFPYSLLKFAQRSNARFRGDAGDGKKLYDGLCSQCHGRDGTGAEGPSLARPRLARAADDESLRNIIVNGIENGRMPPVRQTTTKEQNDLIAYVRSLSQLTVTDIAGNAGRGKEVYERVGCAECHILNGSGNAVGPELTRIAQNLGRDAMRQALVEPAASLPHGTTDVLKGFDEYLPVRVVTRDGQEIKGMRVNEDTFTLQLRDSENQLRSFDKLELRELEKLARQSMMPSFKDQLSASEIDDLIAYLSNTGAK
jgi:cytochrome c oxidase cbb3-type subunit 3